MKILAATFSLFVAMALTSNTRKPNSRDETCQEEFQWLESQGKVSCFTIQKQGFVISQKIFAAGRTVIGNVTGVITIQGQNANPGKPGVDGAILIFNVSFHRLSTTEAITSSAQSETSFCADTDTTTSDNWFSSRVDEASMTTTSTLQSSDGLTTTVVGGVVVAIILLIIVVFVFIRQKKKKNNVPASDVPPLGVNIAHPPEYPYIAASSTSIMITSTRDQIQSNTVHQEPQHVTTYSVVVNTDTGHCNPEHPHGVNPAHDRLPFRDNKISLDSTAGYEQGNYEYVQDPPYETPPGVVASTDSSTLPADDVYNHTHDTINKQLGRHGEGGGGIYSTLATEDTYSHLQGKEHHRFDRQDHGNKNPQLVTAPENHYNHL